LGGLSVMHHVISCPGRRNTGPATARIAPYRGVSPSLRDRRQGRAGGEDCAARVAPSCQRVTKFVSQATKSVTSIPPEGDDAPHRKGRIILGRPPRRPRQRAVTAFGGGAEQADDVLHCVDASARALTLDLGGAARRPVDGIATHTSLPSQRAGRQIAQAVRYRGSARSLQSARFPLLAQAPARTLARCICGSDLWSPISVCKGS